MRIAHSTKTVHVSSLIFLSIAGVIICPILEACVAPIILVKETIKSSMKSVTCSAWVDGTQVGLMTKIVDASSTLIGEYCTPFEIQLPTGIYNFTCTFFNPQRVEQTRKVDIAAKASIIFHFSRSAALIPIWRGIVYHSQPVPDAGRLANSSYYGPHIDQMKDQFNCNVVTAVLWFIKQTDARFTRGDSDAPLTCLESRQEIEDFLAYCSAKDMKVIFRLFGYPYGDGGWYEFRRDGYMNASEYGNIDSWVDYYVGHFRQDSRILAWEIFNEPYFRNPAEPKYTDVLQFIENVADHIRTVWDPQQPITLGSLHIEYNYDSIAILALHGRRKLADYFDIIGFHAYGPMPYEPLTNTPAALTSAALKFGKMALNLEFGTPPACRNITDGTWDLAGQARFFHEICEATELQAVNGLLGCSVWHLPYEPNYPFELVEPNGVTPQMGGEVIIEFYKSWSSKNA